MHSTSPKNFFNFSDINDLTAVIKPGFTISYKELFDQASQISFALSDKGIEKYSYIPLLIEDNLLFIKTVIALWYLGAVPVPLNTKLLDTEIQAIMDDYNFKFLISDSFPEPFVPLSLRDKRKNNQTSHQNTKTQNITKINLLNPDFKLASELNHSTPAINDEAVIIFTSGSTGRPKGVVHTFSTLITSIKNGNEILNHNVKDKWLASLPFYHIGGFQIICRSLYHGCSIILPETLQTNDLSCAIKKYKPTHISLVSSQLDKLLHQKVKPDQSLKVSLIGGGIVDDDLLLQADKLGWKPFHVYGSSETASMITAISANEIKSKPQSAGKSFKEVHIIISSESEILVKSNSLFVKYLYDEKETASKLKDGFYHTGDLGFLDDYGYLFIDARRNDLIVTGGENVNPIEVEKKLLLISGIKDACVFPKQNKTWGQIVAAAIVISDSSLDEKTIKDMLKQKIAGYKIPKEFFFIDKLPHTSLGKLEREKIRKMF
jgi:O-succinylbenzoic acid--CoA ligase